MFAALIFKYFCCLYVKHDENSYRFKIPEDGILKFKDGEKFTIACTTLRHGKSKYKELVVRHQLDNVL